MDAAYVEVPYDIKEFFGKSFGDTVEVILQERESEKTSMWK